MTSSADIDGYRVVCNRLVLHWSQSTSTRIVINVLFGGYWK